MDQGNGKGRWIALSAELSTGSLALTFANYETEKLHRTLKNLANSGAAHEYPKHETDSVDGPQMGLLAVIAHEVGHVFYFERCLGAGFQHCGAQFHTDNWNGIGFSDRTPPRGKSFQDQNRRDKNLNLEMLATQWVGAATPDQATQLFDLYGLPPSSARWVSLLVATAPDEEFVELFELVILRNAATPLKELTIQLNPDRMVNIISSNLAKGPLSRHYEFVRKEFDKNLRY